MPKGPDIAAPASPPVLDSNTVLPCYVRWLFQVQSPKEALEDASCLSIDLIHQNQRSSMAKQFMVQRDFLNFNSQPNENSRSQGRTHAILAGPKAEKASQSPRRRWSSSLLLLAILLLTDTLLCSCARARPFQHHKQGPRQFAATKPVNISTSGWPYSALIPGAPVGSNTLEIYACKYSSGSPCPTLVYIHGGSLMRGDKKSVGSMPDLLNQNGFCLVSLNYPVYGRPIEGLIAQQMSAVASATAWLESNLRNTSPSCTMKDASMIGHSAGAYLAALTLTSPSYRKTANIYSKYILNDSAWYTVRSLARYKDGLATVLGQGAIGRSGRNSLIAEWVPAQLARTSCPKKSSPTEVLIMYSAKRQKMHQAEIKSFASVLNNCQAFSASVSAHQYNHKEMNTSIGETGSSTGAAILGFLKR